MNRFLLGTLLLALCPLLIEAQIPDTLWAKTYGGTGDDGGNSVQQTSDGGYIIAGYTESYGAGGSDVWLIKTNASGDTLWTKTYGGVADDAANSVQQTYDGGYIIIGSTQSFGAGGDDIWLLKTDPMGNIQWAHAYGDSGGDVGRCVQQTADSGYVVTGSYTDFTYWTYSSLWLAKTDKFGNALWSKRYGTDLAWWCGNSVCETYDGAYIVTGWLLGDGAWSPNLLVMKTDSLGDSLWLYLTYGNSGAAGYCVRQTFDHNYIVVGCEGYGGGYPAGPRLYLINIDTLGDTLWSRIYGDTTMIPSYDWHGYSVQQTNDGGFVIAGDSCLHEYNPLTDVLIIRTDANGDTIWQRIYGGDGSEIGNSIDVTSDNGYAVVGRTNSFGAGGDDVWLLKIEPDIGIQEQPLAKPIKTNEGLLSSIFRGPLQLPSGMKCKVFDIIGRVLEPNKIQPGIYFIEVDGVVTQKVTKVR